MLIMIHFTYFLIFETRKLYLLTNSKNRKKQDKKNKGKKKQKNKSDKKEKSNSLTHFWN